MPAAIAPELLCLDLPDADATARLGNLLGRMLRAGDVLLLEGPIGAGKTHFARSLIRARLDPNEEVPSPTFTLVQVYAGAPDIWHTDLYRLTHPDEVIELGLEEAFETGICLIEWPERLGEIAPKTALSLRFSLADGGSARQVMLSGDALWRARLSGLAGV